MANADQQIASLLYNCCQNDIEISKFALTRLQNESVRQFAEKMIAEHTAGCQKLAKFAGPGVGAENRLDAVPGDTPREDRRESRREAREEVREAAPPRVAAEPGRGLDVRVGGVEVQVEPGARPLAGAARASGNLNWVAIFNQISDQCAANFKKELAAKEGAEIDHCYIGAQIMGHMQAQSEINVLRQHASPELRQELDSCLKECAAHLQEAKTIAKQLEGAGTPRVSRRQAELPATAPPATKPEYGVLPSMDGQRGGGRLDPERPAGPSFFRGRESFAALDLPLAQACSAIDSRPLRLAHRARHAITMAASPNNPGEAADAVLPPHLVLCIRAVRDRSVSRRAAADQQPARAGLSPKALSACRCESADRAGRRGAGGDRPDRDPL
jgi:predicted outer membrane protein